MKIFLHDFLYGIIKNCHRTFYSRLCVWVCNCWNSFVFACVIEVHLTDFLSSALFYKVCVNMELSSVLFKTCPHFLHIWFTLSFEVYDLNRITFTSDKVNLAFDDIIWLNQGYIDFCLLDCRPVTGLPFHIEKHLL